MMRFIALMLLVAAPTCPRKALAASGSEWRPLADSSARSSAGCQKWKPLTSRSKPRGFDLTAFVGTNNLSTADGLAYGYQRIAGAKQLVVRQGERYFVFQSSAAPAPAQPTFASLPELTAEQAAFVAEHVKPELLRGRIEPGRVLRELSPGVGADLVAEAELGFRALAAMRRSDPHFDRVDAKELLYHYGVFGNGIRQLSTLSQVVAAMGKDAMGWVDMTPFAEELGDHVRRLDAELGLGLAPQTIDRITQRMRARLAAQQGKIVELDRQKLAAIAAEGKKHDQLAFGIQTGALAAGLDFDLEFLRDDTSFIIELSEAAADREAPASRYRGVVPIRGQYFRYRSAEDARRLLTYALSRYAAGISTAVPRDLKMFN